MPPAGQADGDQPGAEPPGGGAGGRDSSTGDAGELSNSGNMPGAAGGLPNGGDSPGAAGRDAASAGAGGIPRLPGAPGGGDYSLDTLPGGGVFRGDPGAGQAGGDGAMTAAERAAVLDERLRRTYETYDEILRREQADARGAANRTGDSGGDGSRTSGAGGQDRTSQSGGAISNGTGGVDIAAANGRPAGPPGNAAQQQTFPPPEDIPNGRDDDVVARQLREAAMIEADPELREALWDEYRNYTGIGNDQ